MPRLRQLDELFGGRVLTLFSTGESIEDEVLAADVVIGALLVPGASAPAPRLSCDAQKKEAGCRSGRRCYRPRGCFETSKATTHDNPTYEVDGIVHYCVANMPGAVPSTSSYALNNATLPVGLALAAGDIESISDNHLLRTGLNIHMGQVTCWLVAESLNLPFSTPDQALAG